MSKSRRKTKAMKIVGNRSSNKESRSLANRKFRRLSKIRIIQEQNIIQPTEIEDQDGNLIPSVPVPVVPVKLKEVSDPWGFPSDGLAMYMEDLDDKYMRK